MSYEDHGWRHHPKHGTDPTEGAGIPNDWMQSAQSVATTSDGGAPSSPTPVVVPYSSVDETSDTGGDVYFSTAGSPDYITIAQPGGYELCVIASYPQGMTGYIAVAAVIQGDAWLGETDFPGYVPASFPGNVGGGVAVWRQPFAVLDTAVVGSITEVGVHANTWQNSGSNRTANVTLQIKRLT